MADSAAFEAFYHKNGRLPNNVSRPYRPPVGAVKKEEELPGLNGLFKSTMFLNYAKEENKQWRGSPSIPGVQASLYTLFPDSRPENQKAECGCGEKQENAIARPEAPLGAALGEFSAIQ